MSLGPLRLPKLKAAKASEELGGSEERAALRAVLESHTLFKGMDSGKLARLVPAVRFKQFDGDEIVCHCPDATHDGFLLLSGVVATTWKKAHLLYTVELEKPGTLFNLGPLFGRPRNPAGASALGNVEVLAFDSAMLLQHLHEDPEWGLELVRRLGAFAIDQCELRLSRQLD